MASIRGLVATDVHQMDGERLPFADAEFDRVVVVDMLEHVVDDAAFAARAGPHHRPGGLLVVNTPHLKHTALRRVRHALGQTDEKHGHLRPGYTPEGLRALLGGPSSWSATTPIRASSPSPWTPPSTAAWALGQKRSAKGMVVTGDDVAGTASSSAPTARSTPRVWPRAARRPGAASGYMLIASARRQKKTR